MYLLRIGCLLTWLSMKCSIDVVCVIALLYQALERCRMRCLMNGKFANLATFALDMWGRSRMFLMYLYWMPSQMFMVLDDGGDVAVFEKWAHECFA